MREGRAPSHGRDAFCHRHRYWSRGSFPEAATTTTGSEPSTPPMAAPVPGATVAPNPPIKRITLLDMTALLHRESIDSVLRCPLGPWSILYRTRNNVAGGHFLPMLST